MADYKRLPKEAPRTVRFEARQLDGIGRVARAAGLSFGSAVRLLISEALSARQRRERRAA